MSDRLLLCTDLDRTLIPNGPEPESPGAREHFAKLIATSEVTFAMVTGRDRGLVERAIDEYVLPVPDFVIADVGTSIYAVGPGHTWQRQEQWATAMSRDWQGQTSAVLQHALSDLDELSLQESSRQKQFKLSYYVPLQTDYAALSTVIRGRLAAQQLNTRLVWSNDEMAGVGLLDILPPRASKYHAIEALMKQQGFSGRQTVFCGDSGNDIEVFKSPLPSVLVANAAPEVRQLALTGARSNGHAAQLYIARGDFKGMNGNYSAGILEGVAHYHPATVAWMGFSGNQATQ